MVLKTVRYSVVVVLVFLIACSGSKDRKQDNKNLTIIRIGYSLGHLPDIVAKNRHLFEEEFKNDNLQFEYKKFDYGPPLVEAFVSKSVNFGTLGDQPAIIGWAKGADIVIVGNITGGGDKMALITPSISTISSFKELKGKKVAVTIGSNTQHLLYILLQREHMSMSDILLVNLPFSECVNALSQNRIDATILSEPYISLIQQKHLGKIVRFSKELKYVTLPIITSREFLEKYPTIVTRILRVYYRANCWAQLHEEDAASMLFKEEHGLIPFSVDLQLVKKYVHNYGINDSAMNAFKETYHYLLKTKMIPLKGNFSSLVYTKYDSLSRISP